MHQQRRVVICGGIAVGKTTLARQLAASIRGSQLIEEVPGANPFLADFYEDPKRWGFHSRIGMLSLFLKKYLEISPVIETIVFDRCIQELIVFARLHYHEGNMTQKEYALYCELYSSVTSKLPPIDLLLYLHCPSNVSLERLERRARPFERNVTEAYIKAVADEYGPWLESMKSSTPVLSIESLTPIDLKPLLSEIEQLGGRKF